MGHPTILLLFSRKLPADPRMASINMPILGEVTAIGKYMIVTYSVLPTMHSTGTGQMPVGNTPSGLTTILKCSQRGVSIPFKFSTSRVIFSNLEL